MQKSESQGEGVGGGGVFVNDGVEATEHEERVGVLPDIAADGDAGGSGGDGVGDHAEDGLIVIRCGPAEDDDGDIGGVHDPAKGIGIAGPCGLDHVGPEFGDKRCLRLAQIIERSFRSFVPPPRFAL